METPLQIVFREVSHSAALEALIREKVGKLGHIFPRLVRCHLTVGQPHRHHAQGNQFHVRIALYVPGAELVVNREGNEDAYAALNEAFDVARRQLEEHARKERSEVKHPASDPSTAVSRNR